MRLLLCRLTTNLFFGEQRMPVIFRCKRCGKPIYVFERVGQDCFGVPSPSELFLRLGGKCPHCGRPLDMPVLDDIKLLGRVRPPFNTYVKLSYREAQAPTHEGVLTTASVSQ